MVSTQTVIQMGFLNLFLYICTYELGYVAMGWLVGSGGCGFWECSSGGLWTAFFDEI